MSYSIVNISIVHQLCIVNYVVETVRGKKVVTIEDQVVSQACSYGRLWSTCVSINLLSIVIQFTSHNKEPDSVRMLLVLSNVYDTVTFREYPSLSLLV